jgi:uncharacterized protein (DUF488 family)
MKKVYTIGHSNYSTKYFLSLLKKHGITCIVDVRSVPFSKYTPQYNKDDLKKFLHESRIYYIFMGEELGARRSDKLLYSGDGNLDFDKVSKTSLFQTGIDRIKSGIDKGYNIAIMCTEKDPIECHRNILVARGLYRQNIEIYNILESGKVETQEQIEERLLDLYFPNRMQQTLFDSFENNVNNEELIKKAYIYRNRDIAYNINDNLVAKIL